ncbi:MAG: potassium transporter TrkG [Acidimicrobiales bacterium]
MLADDSLLPSLVVRTLAIQSAAILVCGVVEAATDARDQAQLMAIGAALGVLAFALRRWGREPRRARGSTVLPGLGAMWALTVVIATVVFAASDPINLLDGFTEAVAGITTLAVTSVDPDQLSHGEALYRSLLQWLGGLLMINAVLVIIPTFGTSRSAREELGPGGAMARLGNTSARRSEVVNLFYAALTAVVGIGYALAGMPVWDSVNHALTTASTGGFTVTSEGFAAYNAAVQWVAVAGMALAGIGVMWIATAGARDRGPLIRATELRFYALITVVVALIIAVGDSGRGWSTATREGFFSATSAVSTTGFTTAGWNGIDLLGQMLLILLFGVGAAAGSAGGGFGARRLTAMLQMAGRELRTALHHRSVMVVRVDGHAISEPLLDRIAAFAALYLLVVGVGAFGLALAGADMLGSVSGSISAFSTMGPAFGELSGAEHPEAVRLVQITLAVLARMGLFTLTVGMAHAARSVSHAATRGRAR